MSQSETRQLVIIGAGPAGLAAALSAREQGVQDILVLERDERPGGILNQCIHNGFGLHTFHEELTGPEYAQRYIDRVEEAGIECRTGTMVLEISPERCITAVSAQRGLEQIQADAVILAMGCRERPRGALNIPGLRPAGIYSAGTAQKFVNIDGKLPGRRVVILGSGDIGLIMARRMVLSGAEVKAVAEVMPYSGGLKRNMVQCLDDFGIPLLLSHTVTAISGRQRLESVTISEVDENRRPIPGTGQVIDCDTLLLSCGLIPENELSKTAGVALSPVTGGPEVDETLATSVPGIFAAGNVLHVHDLVDFVSQEAAQAGKQAAAFIRQPAQADPGPALAIETGGLVRYTVPFWIHPQDAAQDVTLRFRVRDVLKGGFVSVYVNGQRMLHKKRLVMAPGEMETIVLKKDWLGPEIRSLLVTTEEA